MIEKPHGHRVARLRRNVVGVPGEVSHHLINAVHADCREVIAQRSEIALRVREKPFVNMALNDLALNFQRLLGEIQQIIQPLKKRLLVPLEEVPQPRTVDRHHPQGARLLGGPEKAVSAL